MPILSLSTITPLSRNWTHEEVVSEVAVLTQTLDNEEVQHMNIRNHLRLSVSYLAELLNLHTSPFYGIYVVGILESFLHPSGLEWVDLTAGVNVSNLFADIQRVNFVMNNPTAPDWIGNSRKCDISHLTQLQSQELLQWRFDIGWTHIGTDILFYVGRGIRTVAQPRGVTSIVDPIGYDVSNQTFTIWGRRHPILDTLLARNDPANNYSNITGANANVDLPDQYIDLLVKMTQKRVLEQRREAVPQELTQQVNDGVAMINKLVSDELQFEAAEREKRKYGNPQRPPGAM
jgi:hypothetical protein